MRLDTGDCGKMASLKEENERTNNSQQLGTTWNQSHGVSTPTEYKEK
jgi:hypothetical protein